MSSRSSDQPRPSPTAASYYLAAAPSLQPYDRDHPQHARRTAELEQQPSSSTVDQVHVAPPTVSAAASVGRRSPSRASSVSVSQRSGTSDAHSRSGHVGSRFTAQSVDGTTVSPGLSHKDRFLAPTIDDDGRSYLPDDEVHEIMNHPDVVLAMDSTRFHAGDRKPVDPYWRPRWEMANFHVSLWNALEQVYLHAPHVSPSDAEAFARYGSAVVHAIDFHHDSEEEYYFPSLEVAISMQANLEQHASFDDGLRALNFYLRSCILDPTIFSADTVLKIIDTFAVNLATHFSDELDTLNPDILREYFSIADLAKQGASLQKHVVKDYRRHLYTALPVVIINTPPGRDWPSLSPMYRRVVLPMFLGRKYRTSWKYGKWPSALNVFGGRTSAPPPPSLLMSPSIRGDLSVTVSSQQGSSLMHRAVSFTSGPATVKSDATVRGGTGVDGLPPRGTEAENLLKDVRDTSHRKASASADSGSVGTSSVAMKRSLPPQHERA